VTTPTPLVSGTGAVSQPGSRDQRTELMVLQPLRNSCAVQAPGATMTLNRAGATVRQWDHLRRCWLIPLRDMPAVIRAFKALKAEEYIRKLVDSAPPLSSAQRDRLAVLLRRGGTA